MIFKLRWAVAQSCSFSIFFLLSTNYMKCASHGTWLSCLHMFIITFLKNKYLSKMAGKGSFS